MSSRGLAGTWIVQFVCHIHVYRELFPEKGLSALISSC